MKIEWVNHASYILSANGASLICDPWLSGSAFNHGWSLLSPSVFRTEDFNRITHLWFSHEHPDHFSPPLLKSIPAAVRAKITVLYQKTRDQKILRFCRELGFQVCELAPSEWIELAPGFRVKCGSVPFFDSWLLAEADGKKVLNLNDCVVNTQAVVDVIFRETGKVDVLLSQFSYANWLGNPEEGGQRRAAASEKLARLKLQNAAFQPRWLVPFASYVYFSHEENFYLNAEANRVHDSVRFQEKELRSVPVVLYPGDFWEIGDSHDNSSALERYQRDWDAAQARKAARSESISLERLISLSEEYLRRIRKKNNGLLLFLGSRAGFFKPVTLYLTDLGERLRFDLKRGLVRDSVARGQAQVPVMLELHSDSLAYLLQFEWGFDTLQVNGRFRSSASAYSSVVRTFSIATLNNTGRAFGLSLFADGAFIRRALRKLRSQFLS